MKSLTALLTLTAFLMLLYSGCTAENLTSTLEEDAPHELQLATADVKGSASLNKRLAALRALVAPLHNFERAKTAGWSEQITDCFEDPTQGGMGFHYGNPQFLFDAEANEFEPEALLFEPQKNGKMRLVGVEYIVLFDFLPPDADPPVLFDREMQPNHDAGLWALHAWVGRHNPSGMFADWNPKVNCDHAP